MEQIMGGVQRRFYGERQRVTLEEKYFRRIDKFDGDVKKFPGWRFDVLVAIGQVDKELASELGSLLKKGLTDKWDPQVEDQYFSEGGLRVYQKYKSELFGVLCQLTLGEAKSVVRSIIDEGEGQ